MLDAEVTKSKANADPESGNEGHHDKICDRDSDAVLDACFTCDPKYEVACDTCAKNNMVTAAGEITVTGKCHHETVVRNVVPNIGFDSFIDDWNSDDSKGLTCKDCEALFPVNKQSSDTAVGVHVGKDVFDDGIELMIEHAQQAQKQQQHRNSNQQQFTQQAMQQQIERGREGRRKREGKKG